MTDCNCILIAGMSRPINIHILWSRIA